MEPLNRTTTPADEAEARLIDLLRAADPTTLPEGQKQSSLAAILNPPRARPARRLGLRPAMALGILVLAGASAVAAVGAHLLVRRGPAVEAPVVAPAVEPTPIRIHSVPAAAAPAPVNPMPTPTPSVGAAPAPRSRSWTAPRARAEGENPSAVMDAVKALRQDHDPVAASRLLKEYLRQYPRGSLSEEARALSVEAAVARNSPDVPALAKEYLRLYPNGRFRQAAQHALERSNL